MDEYPLLLMAAGQNTTEQTKPESAKTRGRKPGRGPNQKKQPQRGLGVAQLERLRLQDTGIPHFQSFNQLPDPQRQSRTPMVPLPFTDQDVSVPLQYGAPVLYGAPSRPAVNGCGGLVVQRAGNGGGFGGLCYGGSSGMGGTLVTVDQVGMDPYGRAGDPDPRVFVGTVFEASKELSSMPKMLSGPQRCDACLKKRRGNAGNMGLNGGRDNYSEICPINGSDFLGSNLQNIPNFTGETGNFGVRSSRRGGRKLDEGVEVVAVHRKGSNCSKGGSVLMEYEFFPEKSGRGGTSSEGHEFPTEASVAVGSEASYLPTAAYISTSSSVDLSLKLSY